MTGRRVAVLVATTSYSDPTLQPYGVPVGDGRRLRELLLDPDVGGFDEVVLLANESKSGIERELERVLLHDRAPEDMVLVHMTGCPAWNNSSQLFFSTAGTDLRFMWSTAIPALVFGWLLAESPAQAKVVLLDNSLGAQPFLTDHLGTSSFVLSAPRQLTATVVRGLETGAADLDGDGQISFTDLTEFVRQELDDDWQVCGGAFDGPIRIAGTPDRTAEPVVAAEPVTTTDDGEPELLSLLGISSLAEHDVQRAWRRRPESERYRVPIGVDESGQPVVVDIKNAAMDGMGPHGLCFGGRGADTVDFVCTFMLGLAATHSSQILNFVIVDFDSGVAFRELGSLPHVSALLTGLGDDLSLLDRLMDALAGEMTRRQELLRATGMRHFWEYESARENGADLDPLPALVIVINEFAFLLTAKPGLDRLLVTLGRLGKSLGLHMLLAAHTMEHGSLRALDPFLSYRIGLWMPAEESRVVLGIPDAHELPPGRAAYFKHDVGTLVRFTTATATVAGVDVAGALVSTMLGQGPPAHEVWLPPLDTPCSLDMLVPPLHVAENRGLSPQNTPWLGQLQTPVGVVDKPFEQRRDLLWADFSGAAGHGAVVGARGSGKSMLLRTLVMSMALTQTPLEAQFHCLDFGGGMLTSVRDLPNVGAVATVDDGDLVQRVVAQLTSLVADRERRFQEHGISSMAEFRDRKGQGQITDDPFGDVFLVVDGWTEFRQAHEQLEPQVLDLVSRGLAYGVHVILSAARWADLPPATKELLGTRFELRLDDPAESEVDSRMAGTVPARPGFGLTRDKLHFLVGLPRIDNSASAGDVEDGIRDASGKIRQQWRGTVPPLVRPAPYTSRARTIPIGVADGDQDSVSVDFDTEPHFMVFGETESGKTNVLRTIVRGIMRRYTPDKALIMVVDFRHSLLGVVDTQHLLAYVISPQQLATTMADVVTSMRRRLPGPDVTQEQIKDRSWWSGPELFVVVDDYELAASRPDNPMAPLRELLPLAKEIGLHLVLGRRPEPASRTRADPVVSTLQELGSPGVVLSVPAETGVQLGSYQPTPLPPGNGVLITRDAAPRQVRMNWTEPEA
ncbi:type VII secretion protein EccCb [Kibdelosporangium persicum]|uniref:Type VII secretion protein EccCb n=1 Tax=Kibdelosporangium persicum TaxID=2698649 RepID=A0ABX2FJ18_9PSEU|nr:type VII secretion protein EccCb [Kibdelosporangium persicum]NRN71406.1 Type VII secretion protein EccCb [Kibdelosporangium persicum]